MHTAVSPAESSAESSAESPAESPAVAPAVAPSVSARLRPWRLLLGVSVVLLWLAAIPARGQAQNEPGFILRINGDARVSATETEGAIVVVNGTAYVDGSAEALIVINGDAVVEGGKLNSIFVTNGTARLGNGTVVTGDVELVNAEMVKGDNVMIEGDVSYGGGRRFGKGMLLFGILFGLGAAIAVIVSGLATAAIAPHGVREAGALLTDELGKTFIATLVIWIGFPVVVAIAFMTVVGIPVGLGILVFLLPALAFIGYLIVGIRLGDYLLGVVRGSDEAWHPYLAAIVGLLALLLMGWLPVVGSVVSPIAALLGSGTIGLKAWRSIRQPTTLARAPAAVLQP